jgi:hypothetical protein
MPRRKAGRISDAELARRRRRGATLRELAAASGLHPATVLRRLIAVLGPEYHASGPARGPGAPLRRGRP